MPVADPAPRSRVVRTAGEILLVVALSLALRMFNLLSLPIVLDEATYLSWALDGWDQRTRAALLIPIIDDGKQPLFMWLEGAASYLFPDPLLGGRMVSVLAGAGSTVGIYLAGRWLAGRQVGLVAALLYALVPFNLFYDRTALVEALLNAAGIWAFALSVFVVSRAGGTRIAVLAGAGVGAALGVGIWTKTPALFMLSFPFLCALLLSRRGKLAESAAGFAASALVFGALATLLILMPHSENIWDKTTSFSDSPEWLLALPFDRWGAHTLRYWNWLEAYLPAPLSWLLPVALVWGLFRRTRPTLLLLGCWAAFTMPTLLTAKSQFESRYVSQGVFLLLLLLAALLVALRRPLLLGLKRVLPRAAIRRPLEPLAASLLLLVVMAPSIWFDMQLLSSPESAPLPASDRDIFVTGWSSGYGFMDAVRLVKERAVELTRDGQPVIVLGYYWRGHAHAGLKAYMRRMPGVFHYVDMHLARDPEGFIDAWKPHGVPILIVGNEGLERLDEFERAVPQAKRIGYFPKPGGASSFRVYEVSVEDLTR
ncbi:MAG: ArnT family glycosyltransferase [Chloroflexota bacterium]